MRLIEIAHHRGSNWTHLDTWSLPHPTATVKQHSWCDSNKNMNGNSLCSSGFENNESSFTLALLAGALICSSWASSLGASSLRYHHWISRENGETPTARKAHGISMSSPSPTLTSLGTSVNVAYEENTSTANSAVKRNPSNRFTKAYI